MQELDKLPSRASMYSCKVELGRSISMRDGRFFLAGPLE